MEYEEFAKNVGLPFVEKNAIIKFALTDSKLMSQLINEIKLDYLREIYKVCAIHHVIEITYRLQTNLRIADLVALNLPYDEGIILRMNEEDQYQHREYLGTLAATSIFGYFKDVRCGEKLFNYITRNYRKDILRFATIDLCASLQSVKFLVANGKIRLFGICELPTDCFDYLINLYSTNTCGQMHTYHDCDLCRLIFSTSKDVEKFNTYVKSNIAHSHMASLLIAFMQHGEEFTQHIYCVVNHYRGKCIIRERLRIGGVDIVNASNKIKRHLIANGILEAVPVDQFVNGERDCESEIEDFYAGFHKMGAMVDAYIQAKYQYVLVAKEKPMKNVKCHTCTHKAKFKFNSCLHGVCMACLGKISIGMKCGCCGVVLNFKLKERNTDYTPFNLLDSSTELRRTIHKGTV